MPSRGGGQIVYAPQQQVAPNPLAQFAQQLPSLVAQAQQQRYMQGLMQQQQMQLDAAASERSQALATGHGAVQWLQQFLPQSGATMPKYDLGGALTDMDRENIARVVAQASSAATAPEDTRSRLERLIGRKPPVADNSQQESALMQAAALRAQLEEKVARAEKARAIRSTRDALQYLPEGEREHQSALIENYARMFEAGVSEQAMAEIGRQISPNFLELANYRETLARTQRAEDDYEADQIASPALVSALGRLGFQVPEALAQTTIFGAGQALTRLGSSVIESQMFRANADRQHKQTMDEIEARNRGQAALEAINWERTILDRYMNILRYGRPTAGDTAGVGQLGAEAAASPAQALDWALEEMAPLFAGNPQKLQEIRLQLQSYGEQVLSDYAGYAQMNNTPDEIISALRESGERTPEELAQLRKLLMENPFTPPRPLQSTQAQPRAQSPQAPAVPAEASGSFLDGARRMQGRLNAPLPTEWEYWQQR